MVTWSPSSARPSFIPRVCSVIVGMCVSADGSRLFVAGKDNSIRFVETTQRSIQATIAGLALAGSNSAHRLESAVRFGVVFDARSQHLLFNTTSHLGQIQIYDPASDSGVFLLGDSRTDVSKTFWKDKKGSFRVDFVKISNNGEWLFVAQRWADVEGAELSLLLFWKRKPSGEWELFASVESPHHALITSMAAHPRRNELITTDLSGLVKVWELVALGAWNSVTRLGQLLLDGLNTSIANIMISAAAMTTVSISNQVPTVISNLMGTIAGVFNPQMTIAYAKNDKKQLLDIISSADRIMIFIISIPIAFMTVFGKSFFELWVGETQDAGALYILALLNVGTLFVSASIQVLYHVFLITKRVKLNSVVILVSGALTVATVFVLLETTNLGMYAIVGASMVYGILRNLIFTPLYAARCLEVKWHTFYGDIVLGLVSIGVICLVAAPFELLIEINSWIRLFGVGIAAGILALLVNFFVVLRKAEREMVLGMVKKKLSRNRGM